MSFDFLSTLERNSKILIADPDVDFAHSIRSEYRAINSPPIFAFHAGQAIEVIKDLTIPLDLIFLNPRIDSPTGKSILSSRLQHRPNTPLFYLTHKSDGKFSAQELAQLLVREVITKPVTFEQMLKQSDEALTTFNFDANSAELYRDQCANGTEVSHSDDDFVQIPARGFVAGSRSFFDVYIKINSGKYLKILNTGESFQTERLRSYLEKGVNDLYLRKEAQITYLKFSDEICNRFIGSNRVGQSVKLNQIEHQGKVVKDYLQSVGVSADTISYAEKFATRTRSLVNQLQLCELSAVKEFYGSLAKMDHAVGVSIFGSLIAKNMGMHSEKSVHLIGLSSFFHDIGLAEKFHSACDLSSLPECDRILYESHPGNGVEIMGKAGKKLDSIVLQAIFQHHERRDRTGFPKRLGPGSISTISEIVGISEEFLELLHNAKSMSPDQWAFALKTRVLNCFSSQVILAFKKSINLK